MRNITIKKKSGHLYNSIVTLISLTFLSCAPVKEKTTGDVSISGPEQIEEFQMATFRPTDSSKISNFSWTMSHLPSKQDGIEGLYCNQNSTSDFNCTYPESGVYEIRLTGTLRSERKIVTAKKLLVVHPASEVAKSQQPKIVAKLKKNGNTLGCWSTHINLCGDSGGYDGSLPLDTVDQYILDLSESLNSKDQLSSLTLDYVLPEKSSSRIDITSTKQLNLTQLILTGPEKFKPMSVSFNFRGSEPEKSGFLRVPINISCPESEINIQFSGQIPDWEYAVAPNSVILKPANTLSSAANDIEVRLDVNGDGIPDTDFLPLNHSHKLYNIYLGERPVTVWYLNRKCNYITQKTFKVTYPLQFPPPSVARKSTDEYIRAKISRSASSQIPDSDSFKEKIMDIDPLFSLKKDPYGKSRMACDYGQSSGSKVTVTVKGQTAYPEDQNNPGNTIDESKRNHHLMVKTSSDLPKIESKITGETVSLSPGCIESNGTIVCKKTNQPADIFKQSDQRNDFYPRIIFQKNNCNSPELDLTLERQNSVQCNPCSDKTEVSYMAKLDGLFQCNDIPARAPDQGFKINIDGDYNCNTKIPVKITHVCPPVDPCKCESSSCGAKKGANCEGFGDCESCNGCDFYNNPEKKLCPNVPIPPICSCIGNSCADVARRQENGCSITNHQRCTCLGQTQYCGTGGGGGGGGDPDPDPDPSPQPDPDPVER